MTYGSIPVVENGLYLYLFATHYTKKLLNILCAVGGKGIKVKEQKLTRVERVRCARRAE